MKTIIPTVLILGLTACTSPAVNMTPHQVSQLSNNQLCQLQSSYAWEQKTQIEIGKRNLNCDPAYNQCLSQGIESASPQMGYCIKQTRENWALQNKLAQQEKELKQEQTRVRLLRAQRNLNSQPLTNLEKLERIKQLNRY